MTKTTLSRSVSINKMLMPKAQRRARATDRGNFSAYIERLIQADVLKHPELTAVHPQAVAA